MKRGITAGVLAIVLLAVRSVPAQTASWACEVLPAEHEITTDPISGAKLVFATTRASHDQNLYFHDRSWLSDESMLVFTSDRTGRSELFGYLEATGQLVRLLREDEPGISGVTCSRKGNRIYGMRAGAVVVWSVEVKMGPPAVVRIEERRITDLTAGSGVLSSLNENADGKYLAYSDREGDEKGIHHVVAIEINSGKKSSLATVTFPVYHVQFSWERPDLVMFARVYPQGDRVPVDQDPSEPAHCRLWHVDFSGRPPRPVYPQVAGELVTHECWWTENRFTFCGGHHPEESHLKVFDLTTGRINILGAGSWWAEGTPAQITRRAWWHAAGSPDGRWAVADNFHGDVVLFDGKTTRERVLTTGHREFGKGQPHPHPGWAPSSSRIVFTSNRRGQQDLAIVHVPEGWR